ncbi:MAG: hypothetical protein ABIF92_00580 [archaeon]
MEFDRKTLVLGGIVLLTVIVIAGLVFSPSGFLGLETGSTQGVACIKLGTSNERCDGVVGSDFWAKEDSLWGSKQLCDNARDDLGHPCTYGPYKCSCKYAQD